MAPVRCFLCTCRTVRPDKEERASGRTVNTVLISVRRGWRPLRTISRTLRGLHLTGNRACKALTRRSPEIPSILTGSECFPTVYLLRYMF